MWATLATNATSAPSQKTGFRSMCSGTWPEPRYGSSWITMSPSSNPSGPSSSIVQSTVNLIVPICDGQNSACASMWPRGSKMTHEKSSDSLKIGEYAVVIIVTPMSRQQLVR